MCPVLTLGSPLCFPALVEDSRTAVHHTRKSKDHDLLAFPPNNDPAWDTALKTLENYTIQLLRWKIHFHIQKYS